MTKCRLLSLVLGITVMAAKSAVGLPPPEDRPEEVLRTEIITDARSPIDGKPLTAAEYAQLKAQLEERAAPPRITNSKLQRLIFLLRLRRIIRSIPGGSLLVK